MPVDEFKDLPLYICFILYAICIIILYLPKYDNSYIIAFFIILVSIICIIIILGLETVNFESAMDEVYTSSKSNTIIQNFKKHIGLFILIIALSWVIYLYSTYNNELSGNLINEYKAFHNSIVFMLLIVLILLIYTRDGCGIKNSIYYLIYIILIILYVCIGIMQTMLMYYSTDG